MVWSHKDIWKQNLGTFAVEISRHFVEPREHHQDGGNRWAIYVYIYPQHPLFETFVKDKWAAGSIFHPNLMDIPFHCGQSYAQIWKNEGGGVASIQIGCDYHHEYDERYTFMATEEDAASVFEDAERLIERFQDDRYSN